MWPSEWVTLEVWTDELQARGDPLGEIVALHLRAEQRRRAGGADEAAALHDRAEALRLDHVEALLGPLVGELPRLRLRWRGGLVRAIHLDPPPDLERPRPRLVLSVFDELLRRPVMRYLDDLHVELREFDDEVERGLLAILAARGCQARPRRLVLGGMPRRFRRIQGFWGPPEPARWGHLGPELIAEPATRGLTWLLRWGQIQSLPWAPGDHGSRLQALERELEQPWTPRRERTLGRALWDTSLRVRRRLITALPELPDEAAPLLLPVLAMSSDNRLSRELGELLPRSLTRLSAKPAWVAAVAENFSAADPWVATWLGGVSRRSRAAAGLAGPRLRAMIRRLPPGPTRASLRRAAIAIGGEDPEHGEQPFDPWAIEDETIAELLSKMGERRRAG